MDENIIIKNISAVNIITGKIIAGSLINVRRAIYDLCKRASSRDAPFIVPALATQPDDAAVLSKSPQ